VLGPRQLAGRVTGEGEQRVVRREPAAVVAHRDPLDAALDEADVHVARAGIEGVLNELLHHRRRTLDHLARGDLPLHARGEYGDLPHAFRSGSENEAGILPRDPRLDLGMARFESGAAEQAKGELLRLLDRRLAERIDSRQPARAHRRHLEQVDQLAQRERIDGGQDERRARAPAARQRQLGRVLRAVQQRTQRVAAEAPDLLDVLKSRGDVEWLAVVLDPQEEDDLVARAFQIELELRVLVGAATRPHRRLPVLDDAAVAVYRLAEALAPELAEPVPPRRPA